MGDGWDPGGIGVLELPSGRVVRGHGIRWARPDGPDPEFGLYLLGRRPQPESWPSHWVRWPDFLLPLNGDDACGALLEAWRRAENQRVEIACRGGRGRTGTALACLVVLDGVPATRAVAYVRAHYHPRAVETPWQRCYVARFGRPGGSALRRGSDLR